MPQPVFRTARPASDDAALDPAAQYAGSQSSFATIVPSTNDVIERVTQAVLADLSGVQAFFSRIDLAREQLHPNAYDYSAMVECARLLAHVRPGAICWNGTKAACVDISIDDELIRRIRAATQLPVCTSTLAMEEACRLHGIRNVAVVSPYDDATQRRLIEGLDRRGLRCIAECHGNIKDPAFRGVSPVDVANLARSTFAARPQAVLIYCTNIPGAVVARALEVESGIPVFDSTAAGIWKSLGLIEADSATLVPRWGSLFSRSAQAH